MFITAKRQPDPEYLVTMFVIKTFEALRTLPFNKTVCIRAWLINQHVNIIVWNELSTKKSVSALIIADKW